MGAKIIDRGRGPEIEGTRITVYDVMDYWKDGWRYDQIAGLFRLPPDEIQAAIDIENRLPPHTSHSLRIAPQSSRRRCKTLISTCLGFIPERTASAAAVPAASPVAMHGGISLVA